MSHCDLILNALRDGSWKTTARLYQEVGPMILHSRISDLRHKGHDVQGRHVPGRTGANGYEYRLVAPKGSRSNPITEDDFPLTVEQAGVYWCEVPKVRRPVDRPNPVPAAEQLTVWDAV